MRISGNATIDGLDYLIVYDNTNTTDTWFLFTPFDEEDRKRVLFGEYPLNARLTLWDLAQKSRIDRLVGSVKRLKVSGEVKIFGDSTKILKVMDELSRLRSYGFSPNEIITDSDGILTNNGKFYENMYARSKEGLLIEYNRIDKLYTKLRIETPSVKFDLDETYKAKVPRGIEYTEATSRMLKRVNIVSVEKVRMRDLRKAVNLSWYEDLKDINKPETRVLKKDYRSIKTVRDFELYVIAPMIEEIVRCREIGQACLIALDTETTGLNIFDLPEDNSNKDHIVTLQLSWKDHQGVIIFLDMAYFDNIDARYVIERLYPFFQEDRVEFTINKKVATSEDFTTLADELITLHRNDIDLTGHNVMFDGRVCFDVKLSDNQSDDYQSFDGYKRAAYFFDEDSLQMVFNLNPTFTKGHKGLKDMTRHFFGHETPELKDLLGKGNEDKFRYLSDEEVAIVYGCADTDYSRLVQKELKAITEPKMYRAYKNEDPYTWFMLYQSEYIGMTVDREHLKKATEIIEHDLEAIENFIYDYTGYMLTIKKIREDVLTKYGTEISREQQVHYMSEELNKIKSFQPYKFKITGSDVRDVLYNKLEYPILAWTDKGEPAVNSDAIKRLLTKTNSKGTANFLKEDLKSYDGESVLISAKKFGSYAYPLAFVLSKFKELEKEYTGYYKPFKTEDQGGRIFRTYSTTNIETRRISNSAQTIKKNLKKCIIAHKPDFHPANWDLNQVEARIFTSFAGDTRMITKLNNPENDYHTENAALVFDRDPWKVPKDLRKAAKPIGFGLIYGLGDRGMCQNIHTTVNTENMIDTRRKIAVYKEKNALSMAELDSYRVNSVQEWDMPIGQRKLVNMENEKVSRITNRLGFHRVFKLGEAEGDKGKLKSIERAAGNFPIQSYAASLFRLLLKRFYIRLKKENLRHLVIIHMLIHDEIQFSFHKSINPAKIMEMVKEECMIRMPGHCTYFVGLNFGKSWYECKQDESECPVKFVEDMTHKFKDGVLGDKFARIEDVKEWIQPKMHQFFLERCETVLKETLPTLTTHNLIDFNFLLDNFTNYTVRSYMTSEFGNALKVGYNAKKPNKPNYDGYTENLALLNGVCGWASELGYLDLKILAENKKVYTVGELLENPKPMLNFYTKVEVVEDDFGFVDVSLEDEDDVTLDDEYWSFDENEDVSSYVDSIYDNSFFDEEEKIGEEYNVVVVREKDKVVYKNIDILHGDIVILKVKRDEHKVALVKSLQNFQDPNGSYLIKIRSPKSTLKCFRISTEQLTLSVLDQYIEEVLN